MLYRLMVVSSTPSLMAGVWVVRDWSLGMGKGGGVQNGRRGVTKVLAMLKGEAHKPLRFYAGAYVLAILKGGAKCVCVWGGGGKHTKFYPVSNMCLAGGRGGGGGGSVTKSFRLVIFPLCTLPSSPPQ